MFRMIKAVTVMAGVLLVSTGASQAQVIYGQENSNLTRANQSMMAGDLESASKYFRRAVKANLGHERLVPTLNNYCAVEYAIGNFENAEKVCSEAISNDRRYWRAYVNRANVRAALGDAEGAAADYDKALSIKPNSRIAADAFAKFQAKNATLLAAASR
ncbi:MAG: tetratricopeptide repeat protein [Kordiimonadaceae bacterium]|nr:tetratricopeptide repeat protein [Kordiimonadaceae bacterium]MBO6569980.1 tetratricopeptide repeat protein [Kordiimonadaceae bacterium]MBO6965923.1 tetratricopeptide repeat protein [Kordiimonadaceae bacterium]